MQHIGYTSNLHIYDHNSPAACPPKASSPPLLECLAPNNKKNHVKGKFCVTRKDTINQFRPSDPGKLLNSKYHPLQHFWELSTPFFPQSPLTPRVILVSSAGVDICLTLPSVCLSVCVSLPCLISNPPILMSLSLSLLSAMAHVNM